MRLPHELAAAVHQRAHGRCQYCLMLQRLQGATFHIEHILPLAKGGTTDLTNLTLACPGCNLCKADRTHAADPLTGLLTPLFHPLRQKWSNHFRLEEDRIEGSTPVGRATVDALNLNHPRRVDIRRAERRLGFLPPPAVEGDES